MALDEHKLHEFLGKALVDLGGAVNAVLMSIGDELGLYKALAKGPQSPAELARNTNTNERYVREWLNSQAAGGYVTFDKATAKYSLSEEQELCLANPAGPSICPARPCWCRTCSMCVNVRWRIFGPAEVWNGESMTLAYSAAPNDFSVPVIMRIFFHRGFRRSTGSTPNLEKAERSLMLVAVTAQAPFCSPRRSPNLNSLASTITDRLSRRQPNVRRMPAPPMRDFRLPTPPIMGERTSI